MLYLHILNVKSKTSIYQNVTFLSYIAFQIFILQKDKQTKEAINVFLQLRLKVNSNNNFILEPRKDPQKY